MRGFLGAMLISILLLPSLTYAHPGKTDRRGGHACRKDCSEWELYVGEYHLHEEDFQPVRPKEKVRPKTARAPENNTVAGPAGPSAPEPVTTNTSGAPVGGGEKQALPAPQPVSAQKTAAAQLIPGPDSTFPYNPWLLLAALILLLLLVLVRAIRKSSDN